MYSIKVIKLLQAAMNSSKTNEMNNIFIEVALASDMYEIIFFMVTNL